jgi:hypothetical protein
MRAYYVPITHCEKMAVTDMQFRQSAVLEFLVTWGNSALSSMTDFVVCMEMSAWLSACQKEIETF